MKYLPLLVLLPMAVACGGNEIAEPTASASTSPEPTVSPTSQPAEIEADAEEEGVTASPEPTVSPTSQPTEIEVDAEDEGVTASPEPTVSPTSQPAEIEADAEDEGVTQTITGHADIVINTEGSFVNPFFGEGTLQERIVGSDAIVRSTMDTAASEIIHDADEKYRIALKFTFTVHEYLQGSGANTIVVYWVDGRQYETSAAATGGTYRITAWRDAQWDDREAILFLIDDHSHLEYLGSYLDDTLADANTYIISVGGEYTQDDNYSLYSERWRVWLPSASAPGDESEGVSGQSGTTTREYLLDVPARSASGEEGASGASPHTAPTITLADLKTQINTLNTAISASSDPEGYRECLVNAYLVDRIAAYRESQGRTYDERDIYGRPHIEISAVSGQPVGTIVDTETGYGTTGTTVKTRMWLEGGDADLFTVTEGPQSPYIGDDAPPDAYYTFDFQFKTARPLPAGEYITSREEIWLGYNYNLCEKSTPLNWTLTVTAPEGTVHEAFFDPVSVDESVHATATAGVLKPRTFTGGRLNSISYTGTGVEIGVTPETAFEGKTVEFLDIEGRVALSLGVSEATVDADSDTLTWSVPEAPWADGDKLMVRFRTPAP